MVKSSPINIIWIKSRILSAEGAHLGRGSMRWILSTGRALLHGRNKLSVKIYNLVYKLIKNYFFSRKNYLKY